MYGKTNKKRSAVQYILGGIISSPLLSAIIVFFIIGALSASIIYNHAKRIKDGYRKSDLVVLESVKERLQQSLNQSLSATQALAFIVRNEGLSADFDSAASGLLAYNKYIDALQLVPGGIIRYVYPLKGNEQVINYDILNDSARNKEAYKAIEKKQIYFAGPFELRQGGIGVVGRLPVFIDNKFWGFSAVVIRLQTLLNAAGIDSGTASGYRFQLSKINPENGQEEFFLPVHERNQSRSTSVVVPDGEWKLSITSVEHRSLINEILPLVLLGILLCFATAWVSWLILKKPAELQKIVAEKSEQLNRSNKRNHAIVTAIPDTIFIMDEKGNFIDFNNPFNNPLLVGPENFIGKNVAEILPADLAKQTILNIEAILKEKKPIVHSYQLHDSDNNLSYFEATYSLIGVNEVMSIVRDVTDRVTAERTARQNEEKLRHVLTSSADDFYVIDKNFRITLINDWAKKNLTKAWGKQVDIGVNLLDVIPEKRKEIIIGNFNKVFDGKRIEYEVERFDEEYHFWVQVNYLPVFNQKGNTTGAIVLTKDITKRKNAEDELRQINNRFEMISLTTNDAVWEWDLVSGKLWSNETHQHLYGLTKEDPVPTEDMWVQRIHPDDRDRVVKTQERILASDKNVFISEYRFFTEKEGYRDLYDRCYIVRDDSGKPVRMMGSMMDITDRKRAEKATKESEETQRLIMNTALDAIVCANTSGEITIWTPQAEKVFGWKEKDVIGKLLTDTIIPVRFREAHINGMQEYLKTGKARMLNRLMEVTALNASGDEFPVELSITPVEQGDSLFFCAFIRDITERKKAESELRESEEKYRVLVENAPEALVVFDIELGKFISVSESAVKLFKMPKDELLKIGPLEISPEFQPDGRLSSEASVEMLNRTIAGEKLSFEWTHCDSKNEPIACEVRLVRLPSEKSILIRGSIVDIGERKKAERGLQESEEKYRTFFENSLDGIMLTVPDGRILSANPAACIMFGMTEDEIIAAGRSALVDLSDENLSGLLEQRRLRGKASGELTMIRKDGSKFPAEVTSAIFMDAYGNERTSMIIRDITERKRTEEEIIRTNARFNIVSKATSDIVWEWDLTSDELWWNDNYYINLGYRRKKGTIKIDDWVSRIHPADSEKVEERLKKAITGKNNVWRDEYRYAKSNNEYLHFLDRGFIIRDKDGIAIRMIGSMVDMTPIYMAQKEVAESENRLRTILDTDPECIKLLGSNCELYEINKAGLDMLEVSEFETIKGHSILPVVAVEQRARAEQLVKNAFKGISGKMEFEMHTFKGNRRWCEINVVPFRNAEGEILLALGVTIDITEKRKAELELKQSEEKYRTLVEQAVDAIALYDATGKVLDVNSGASELLGYSKDELTAMYLHQILIEEELVSSPVRYDILQRGESTIKQRKLRRKNGSVVVTEVRSQQLPDGRFLSVIRDMTERIRTEEELKDSYKAIRKLTAHLQNIREEERSHIAREIHDELGQQLTVLKMDVSWLNKKLGSDDPVIIEKIHELLTMLDNIVKSVRRISSELRPSLLDDLGLIAAMEWQLNEFEKRSGIKTKLVAPEKELLLSNNVKTALFRIFQESLTNVVRHSGAQNLSVNLEQKNGDFILSISDNGKGFDKQAIAEKRTLGILGMNERSQMIGGTYEIISEPGKGTHVSVKVPAKTDH